ncbi:MAG: S8 family serine peptidase [Sumerlaeia bacterium]
MTRAMFRSFRFTCVCAPLLTGVFISGILPSVSADQSAPKDCLESTAQVHASVSLTDSQIIGKYLPHLELIQDVAAVRTKGALPVEFHQISFDRQSMISVVKSEDVRLLRDRSDLEFYGAAFSLGNTMHVLTDSIVVKFAEGVSPKQQQELLAAHGFSVLEKPYAELTTGNLVTGVFQGSNGLHILEHAEQLRANPLVAHCITDWFTTIEKTNYTGEFGIKDVGGTSAAAAIAAGVAGLVWNANPDLDPYQVMDILRETANPGSGSGTPDFSDEGAPPFYLQDSQLSTYNWETLETEVKISNGYGLADDDRFTTITRRVNRSDLFGDGVVNPVEAVQAAFSAANNSELLGGLGSNFFLNPTNNPLHAYQWYLNDNQGEFQDVVSPIASLNISGQDGAWSLFNSFENTTGASMNPDTTRIRYIVIDDGIAVNHPEINLIAQFDIDSFFSNSTTAQPRSGTGHGTAVAGILAARDNDTGIVGVTPGFPVIGIRAMNTEGRRGNNSFVRVSRVLDAINIAAAIAQSNPQNRYVVLSSFYTFANDPSIGSSIFLQTGLFESLITEYAKGTPFNNNRDGLLFVFPSGNGNDISWATTAGAAPDKLIDLYAKIGAQETQEDDTLDIQSALIVGAIHSGASAGFIVEQGEGFDSKASYSNFSPSLSLVAPSGDDVPPGSGTDLGLRLQLVSTSTNLLSLGGETLLPYDVAEFPLIDAVVEIPSPSVVGISNWNQILLNNFTNNEFNEENKVLFLARGFTANVPSGTVDILPNVIQTENGELIGSALIQIRNANGTITNSFAMGNVRGRFRYTRAGTYKLDERISSSFTLTSRDAFGNIFQITGVQNATILNGVLRNTGGAGGGAGSAASGSAISETIGGNVAIPRPIKKPKPVSAPVPSSLSYKVTGAIRLAGVGTTRFNGNLYAARMPGTVGNVTGPGVNVNYGLGTFYSPDISLTRDIGSRSALYTGSASLDSDYRFVAGSFGDRRNVVMTRIDYSTANSLGRYIAIGRQGSYSARAQGLHTASIDQKPAGVEITTISSYPTYTYFRSPAAVNVVQNRFPFQQLTGD